MFAKVENNQVVGTFIHLPQSFANVSGFNNLPVADLITYGYYPMEEVKPDLAFVDIGEVDSPVKIYTQYYGQATDQILASKVVRTYSVANKDQASLNAEIAKVFTDALEAHYDKTAQEKRYDNRFTCSLRAGYVSAFQAEGLAFATWMDTCNVYAYVVMADVIAGTKPMPTISQLISELPVMTWPT